MAFVCFCVQGVALYTRQNDCDRIRVQFQAWLHREVSNVSQIGVCKRAILQSAATMQHEPPFTRLREANKIFISLDAVSMDRDIQAVCAYMSLGT